MGEGINKDAPVNRTKKTMRIATPFNAFHTLLVLALFFSSISVYSVSSIAIFNKPSRMAVELKYNGQLKDPRVAADTEPSNARKNTE